MLSRDVLVLVTIQLPLCAVARVYYGGKGSGTWLLAEREGEACDNAFELLKYLVSEHAEIPVSYVATGATQAEVRKYVEPIRLGSLAHYWAYARSSVAVSTHAFGSAPLGRVTMYLAKVNPGRLVVHIRHGVSKDHYSIFAKERLRVDLLTTTSAREHAYYATHCGYEPHELRLTGMCRYDRLSDLPPPERQILFMPTFRSSLQRFAALPDRLALAGFRESTYYSAIHSLLTHPDLGAVLEKHDATLVFNPHPRVSRYLPAFEPDLTHSRIVDAAGRSIPMLIDQSAALITDYSSVFFDFAMLGRPVLHYQFEGDDYRQSHYAEGYFSYEQDGFGPVLPTPSEVIKELDERLTSSFAMQSVYARRRHEFFTFWDSSNRERVFSAISEHPKMATVASVRPRAWRTPTRRMGRLARPVRHA